MVDQKKQVVASFLQQRQGQLHYAETVEQVFSQLAGLHTVDGVLVDGRDDFHVDGDWGYASDPSDFLFLDRLEDLCLDTDLHGIDFIEKNGTAVGNFKDARPVLRSGITAFDRAEEDAFQQISRDGRTIL